MSNRNIVLHEAGPIEAETPSPVSGPPAHVERAALGGLAGDIVGKILPHTEAGEAALLFNLVIGFGNIVGRNRYTLAGNSRHYPNLFGVLVGASGKGRKGTSWNAFKPILTELDEYWFDHCRGSGMNSGEGLIYHVRDDARDKKGENIPGVSDKRLFVIEEELASVLKRMKGQSNSLAAVIRDAWDGNDLRSMIKNSPDRATAPCISILAHITKAEVIDLLTGTDCQNGFANRFLWPYTERSKFLPDGGRIPMETLHSEILALKAALEKSKKGDESEIDLSPEAKELWRAVYRNLSEGKPGLYGSVTGRAEAQVRRLALTYSLIEGEDETSVQSLEAALAFWRYCDRSAGWLFGTPFNHPDADRIFDALRGKPEGMTRTEISCEVFKKHAPEPRIQEALSVLEKGGAAYMIREKTAGADRERWFLTGAAK
jgi:hypothetical protein